jgi:hypothetical protein
MELFVLTVMVAGLWHCCARAGTTAGDVFAIFGYILMFVAGLDSIPLLVQRLGRLYDIGRRMSKDPTEEEIKGSPGVAERAARPATVSSAGCSERQ